MRALIIEDQTLFAMLIEDELRDLGYTSIDIADSEVAAIKSATLRCPDLITADERLASGSGVAAIRTICADRRIPFVFITSYRKEVREQLPDAVLLGKPFSPPTLRDAVEQAIRLSKSSVSTP